jgi:hypothetical protein
MKEKIIREIVESPRLGSLAKDPYANYVSLFFFCSFYFIYLSSSKVLDY